MTRHTTLSGALVALGIALLVAPALFPLQPVLYHDTRQGTTANGSQLEQGPYEIVAYENLSERGQELYVRTLRNGGEHSVAIDSGALDFQYPTNAELAEAGDYTARNALRSIVIERPPNADLPPADEPLHAAEHVRERDEEREPAAEEREPASNRSRAEIRRQIARYDVMTTRTDKPPLTAPPSLLRLLSAVAGVLAVGTGGYLWSKP